MNTLNWLFVIIVFIINIFSFYLLLINNEKKAENVKQNYKIKKDAINNKLIIYSVVMIIINIGISVFLCLVYKDNTIFDNIKTMCLLSLLWPCAYIDFKFYRIPNMIIGVGIIYRLFLYLFEGIFLGKVTLKVLATDLIAAGALLAATLLCNLIMKNSIGYGDIKLFAIMGLLLGIIGIWGAVFISLIISFVVAIIALITKRKGKKECIPFGPAIMIGTYLSVILTGV